MIYVVDFDPIKILTCWALQNDHQNLSFVKDEDTYGKKMARIGRTKVIYKGTFISKQSLFHKSFLLSNVYVVNSVSK